MRRQAAAAQRAPLYRAGKAPDWIKLQNDNQTSTIHHSIQSNNLIQQPQQQQQQSQQQQQQQQQQYQSNSNIVKPVQYQQQFQSQSHPLISEAAAARLGLNRTIIDNAPVTVTVTAAVSNSNPAATAALANTNKEINQTTVVAKLEPQTDVNTIYTNNNIVTAATSAAASDNPSESDSESESESVSSESDNNRQFVPVFRSKSDRINSTNTAAAVITAAAGELLNTNIDRKESAKQYLLSSLSAEAREHESALEQQESITAGLALIPIDKDPQPNTIEYELAFEQWQLREYNRYNRDRLLIQSINTEQAELDRRRQLTDKELMEEDAEKLSNNNKNRLIMSTASGTAAIDTDTDNNHTNQQQYYPQYRPVHRGPFFQDDSSVVELNRSVAKSVAAAAIQPITVITASTASTAVSIDPLSNRIPAVMQVKNFGLKGRTKWNGLHNEDTSSKRQRY